ncbi:hypothetical protein GCM10017750_27730 [Streptomyces racemochromogenes]
MKGPEKVSPAATANPAASEAIRVRPPSWFFFIVSPCVDRRCSDMEKTAVRWTGFRAFPDAASCVGACNKLHDELRGRGNQER